MAKASKVFQIFRAGTNSSYSTGEVTMTVADIQKTAQVYAPAIHSAGLVLGHPSGLSEPVFGEADSLQNYGRVISLFVEGDALFAEAEVEDPLIQMVRAGQYVDRSAGFWPPGHPGNPVPGSYYLNHVGFLGKAEPGVTGMPPLVFSAPRHRNPLIADAERRAGAVGAGAIAFAAGRSTNPLIADAERRAREHRG
jgi:hypothetical protein